MVLLIRELNTGDVMRGRAGKIEYQIKRFGNFIKVFFRNKLGLAGIIIILAFTFMAVGAPLLTDKDPVRDENLAGDLAAPIWIKWLPSFLGGNPSLSENFQPLKANFADGIQGANCISDSSYVGLDWESNFGYEGGSLLVSFKRTETGVLYGLNNVTVYYDFHFPYGSSPRRFYASTKIFVNGTFQTYVKKVFWFYNLSEPDPSKAIVYNYTEGRMLVAPPVVRIFIQRLSDNAKWYVWPLQNTTKYFANGTIFDITEDWINVRISSHDSDVRTIAYNGVIDVSVETFKQTPGDYRYGFDISFVDKFNSTIPVNTNIYIDDVSFYCAGRAYGLLGTDAHGRDLWSQLVYGARVSLYVGVLSAVISVVIGLIVGLCAGFLGSAVDEVLMRITDFWLVVPFLPLMLILVSVFGPTLDNLIIIVGLLGWMGFARVVRSQVLSLKERAFIEAARAVGAGRSHIIFRHILPNVMSLVYVTLASSVPGAITIEAALSFLGFYDPVRVSWGRMLNEAMFIGGGVLNWWWVIFPGLCIALLAMAFILLGFALDEILNPKLRLRK